MMVDTDFAGSGTNPNGDPEIADGNPVLAEMAKQNYIDESEDVTESDVEIKDVVISEHNAKLNISW
jgi:hypothetical protein